MAPFTGTTIEPLPAFSHAPAPQHGSRPVRTPASADGELDLNLDEFDGQPDLLIGGPPSVSPHDHLLDFDLPDIDTSAMRPKKTGP
jgi:hypothetical protein